jgi:integrating conjugative element protein (TIGR03755 family)
MKLLTFAIGFLVSSSVLAGSLFPNKSEYYYKLGGDSDLYVPPVNRDKSVTIGGSLNTNVLNCSMFNPTLSLTNTLNDLKSSVHGMPSGVIDNLKGSVAGFPLYKLQQAMPGLYNILQNTAVGNQNEFSVHVEDCQNVKRHLEEGNSPLSGILTVSDSQGWIDAAKSARNGDSVDITKRAKDIAQKGEEYGLPWVHRDSGNSGGANQVAIQVINDVVIAGYNLLLTPSSRKLDDKSVASDEDKKNNRFAQFWPKPAEAADWAVLVLGDIQISHKKEASFRDAKAGIGLSTLLHACPKTAASSTCVSNVAAALWNLVDKKWALTEANLRKISASNVVITDEIITSIMRMPREQQIITVSKLAEEIAIQNLLDEAIMLRHLLQAGMQIQEVQNLKPAQKMVQSALDRLDKEIQSLSFESEVRKKMMTQTLNLIMELRNHDLAKGMPGTTHEEDLIKNGAVYRNTDKKEKGL